MSLSITTAVSWSVGSDTPAEVQGGDDIQQSEAAARDGVLNIAAGLSSPSFTAAVMSGHRDHASAAI